MELALDEFGLKKTSQKDKFQSLFSWNLLLMTDQMIQNGKVWQVSILVFVELALDVVIVASSIWQILVSILVFVELALDARSATVNILLTPGFNPCFRGTCS